MYSLPCPSGSSHGLPEVPEVLVFLEASASHKVLRLSLGVGVGC